MPLGMALALFIVINLQRRRSLTMQSFDREGCCGKTCIMRNSSCAEINFTAFVRDAMKTTRGFGLCFVREDI
jgi:hypothetical protein